MMKDATTFYSGKSQMKIINIISNLKKTSILFYFKYDKFIDFQQHYEYGSMPQIYKIVARKPCKTFSQA